MELELLESISKSNKFMSVAEIVEKIDSYIDDLAAKSVLYTNRELHLETIESKYDFGGKKYFLEYIPRCEDVEFKYSDRISLQELVFSVGNGVNLADEIMEVLEKVPCEVRKAVSTNIVVSGGNSMGIGFMKRMV